ncbi:MAG: hypothetical protein IPK22_09160 [Verrucomicrobiaceae bacterium]|nr:hypothetical protein [Verrucomicrobiaceae bacterium]
MTIYCELIDESVQLQIEAAKRCDKAAYDKALMEKLHFIAGLRQLLRNADIGLLRAQQNEVDWIDRIVAWYPSWYPGGSIDGVSPSDQLARLKKNYDLGDEPKAERPSATAAKEWVDKNKYRAWYNPKVGDFEYRKGFYPDTSAEENELLSDYASILQACIDGLDALAEDIRTRLDEEEANNFWKDCPPPDPVELDFGKLSKDLSYLMLEFYDKPDNPTPLRDIVGSAWERLSKEERELIEDLEERAGTRVVPEPKPGEKTSLRTPFPDKIYSLDPSFIAWRDKVTEAPPPEKREVQDDKSASNAVGTQVFVSREPVPEEAMFRTLPKPVQEGILRDLKVIAFKRLLHGYVDGMSHDGYLMRLKEVLPDRQIPRKGSAVGELNHVVMPLEATEGLVTEVLKALNTRDVMPPGIDPVFLSTIRNDYNNLRQGIFSSALLQRPMTATERKTAEYYLTEPFSVKAEAEESLWTRGPCAEMSGYTPPPGGKGDIVRVVSPVAPDPAANQAYALRIKAEQGALFEKYRRWLATERLRRSLDPVNWMVPKTAKPEIRVLQPKVDGLGTPPPGTLPPIPKL